MKRIQSTDAAVALPAASESGTTGYFTNGDPGTATPATTVTAEWLNRVQEEICYVIEQNGITLDGADTTQLYDAIVAMVAPDASDTVKGKIEIAVQSEMETASSTTLAVTPGRVKYSPFASKAWSKFAGQGSDGACTVNANAGVSGVERLSSGNYRITWSTAFSSANYAVVATSYGTPTGIVASIVDQATTHVDIQLQNLSGTLVNPTSVHVVAFGDL